jgi:hypothetical protein
MTDSIVYFWKNHIRMKFVLPLVILIAITAKASAQYYYKDIIGTKETTDMMKTYLANKVSRVKINSYDAQDTKTDDIYVEQVFSPQQLTLTTTTSTDSSDGAILVTYINSEGQVIKTADSSEGVKTITYYKYNTAGLPDVISSVTSDTSKNFTEKEDHLWLYKDGKANRMLRIKNGTDTMYVDFKLDENGNVAEENSVRKGVKADPVYYYYDKLNRITDIVRYNNKAKRLLPEYMFEYSPTNQVIQRITVPANGSKYLIWRYQYDNRGLKIKEAIYDRYKQLNGKVEYLYSFAG